VTSPRVTVVVPSYNGARFLPRALDSIAAQTFRDYEVVVVDNYSTDDTEKIARSYSGRLPLSFVTAESNLAEARDIGMKHARGEYIAFLDTDDEWRPDKLRKQVEFLDSHRDIPLCHTCCEIIDEDSNVLQIRHDGLLPPTGPCYYKLLEHCWITISTVMIRRTLFTEDGILFPPLPKKGGAGEDLRFYLQVARRYPLGLVDEVLAGYRKTSTGLSGVAGWRTGPQDMRALELVLNEPQCWEGFAPRETILQAITRAAAYNSAYWRNQGMNLRAIWFAGKGLRHGPFSVLLWRELSISLAKGALSPMLFVKRRLINKPAANKGAQYGC